MAGRKRLPREQIHRRACESTPARDLNGSIWVRDRWCEQLLRGASFQAHLLANVVQTKPLLVRVKVPRGVVVTQ
jgi:hypothetical protein